MQRISLENRRQELAIRDQQKAEAGVRAIAKTDYDYDRVLLTADT